MENATPKSNVSDSDARVFDYDKNWSQVVPVLDDPLALRALNAGMTSGCDKVGNVWLPDNGCDGEKTEPRRRSMSKMQIPNPDATNVEKGEADHRLGSDGVRRPATELFPEAEAERFIEASKKDGYRRLVYWRETFWYWRQGRYQEMPKSEVQAELTRFLNQKYSKIGRHALSNVLAQIEAQAILSARIEPPIWLGKVPGADWPCYELVVARNEIVHLPSLIGGKPYSVPPTPALFNVSALDTTFIDPGKCPPPDRWYRFLDELWEGDAEAIEALQLWAGYLLVPDTRQQKLLALFGPKRSGKGTIVRVLRALVGHDNTASPTLSSFAQNFGLWPLMGKTLAVISDARLSGRPDVEVITERLLSITGEDALTIDRKYLTPITCTLPTRIMLVSNELPRLSDASGALVSRMIVLRLTESWYDREDKSLTDALMRELPAILWWAVKGWHKLQERGSLLQPKSGTEVLAEWEDLTSPVGAFVRERCEVAPQQALPRAELYGAFKEWATEQGRLRVPDEAGFGRDLRAAVPSIGTSQRRIWGK